MNQLPVIVPIADFPGYGVSSDGTVWTCKNYRWGVTDVWRKLDQHLGNHGYLYCNFTVNYKTYSRTIHRLVASHFVECDGNPAKLDVNHKDGIKTHNNSSNLEWVSRSENMKHAYANGLWAPPTTAVKMTKQRVIRLRALKATGRYTRKELSCMFQLSESQIQSILSGKSWSEV